MENKSKKSLFYKVINRETVLYVVFGVLTTAVNLIVYTLLNYLFKGVDFISNKFLSVVFLGRPYLLSNVIAWFAAVTFAFFTNKLIVFKSPSFNSKILFKEGLSFFGARVFSLLIEQAGLYLLIDMLSQHELLSKIIISVVVVILNYFFSKLLIFNKKKS